MQEPTEKLLKDFVELSKQSSLGLCLRWSCQVMNEEGSDTEMIQFGWV